MKLTKHKRTHAVRGGLIACLLVVTLGGCDAEDHQPGEVPGLIDHSGHSHDQDAHDQDGHKQDEGHPGHNHDQDHAGHDHGTQDVETQTTDDHEGHDHDDHASADGGANTLMVSPAVQRNLGITFAQVERRAVTQTLRVPGQFELIPSAQRDYHAPVAGRIELHVEQYAAVKAGQLLATIDSPAWREQQSMLTQGDSATLTTEAAVTIAEAALREQQQGIALLEERVERLASAEVRRVELNNELKQARLVLPRLDAELKSAKVQVRESKAQRRAHLQTASSKTGLSIEALAEVVGELGGEPLERWQQLNAVPIKAVSDGIVDLLAVTRGRWVETGDEVVIVIQPNRLRFRAETLLADSTTLRSGLPTLVVPPLGRGLAMSESAAGELFIGPTAHAEDRTIAIYSTPRKLPGWAKAGVPGFIEITLTPDAPKSLAIPRSALVQDGLDFVFFRRDPHHPEQVQRVVANTGETDGRWIEISTGLDEGDEVVVEGVYQLLAASSTTMEEGGHFHSDGTFHEGEDE